MVKRPSFNWLQPGGQFAIQCDDENHAKFKSKCLDHITPILARLAETSFFDTDEASREAVLTGDDFRFFRDQLDPDQLSRMLSGSTSSRSSR